MLLCCFNFSHSLGTAHSGAIDWALGRSAAHTLCVGACRYYVDKPSAMDRSFWRIAGIVGWDEKANPPRRSLAMHGHRCTCQLAHFLKPQIDACVDRA